MALDRYGRTGVQLIDEALEEIRSKTGTSANLYAVTKKFLNMALLELQTMHSWKFMKRESTFATVADQRHVNMPVDFYDAELIVPTDPPSSIAYLEKYDHGAALRRWKLTETGEPEI